MKTINRLIEVLIVIGTAITRRKSAKRATRVAVHMALNGCR